MFNYRTLVNIIFLINFSPLFSQKDTSEYFNKRLNNNNFSLELGGKAFLYSIGYERTIIKSKTFLLAGDIGFSYYPPFFGVISGGLDGVMLPIGLKALIGKSKNKLLIGVNGSNYFANGAYRSIYNNYPLYKLFFVPSVGYRKYFTKGNSLTFVIITFFEVKPFLGTFPWLGINYNIKF